PATRSRIGLANLALCCPGARTHRAYGVHLAPTPSPTPRPGRPGAAGIVPDPQLPLGFTFSIYPGVRGLLDESAHHVVSATFRRTQCTTCRPAHPAPSHRIRGDGTHSRPAYRPPAAGTHLQDRFWFYDDVDGTVRHPDVSRCAYRLSAHPADVPRSVQCHVLVSELGHLMAWPPRKPRWRRIRRVQHVAPGWCCHWSRSTGRGHAGQPQAHRVRPSHGSVADVACRGAGLGFSGGLTLPGRKAASSIGACLGAIPTQGAVALFRMTASATAGTSLGTSRVLVAVTLW